MATDQKGKIKAKTQFVVLKFTKPWGSKKVGDRETYHVSTANALVEKKKVAEVVEEVAKWVPKKAAK